MTKQDTYRITRKLYHFLKNNGNKVEFKKIREKRAFGYYYDDGHIEIDYRKNIIATLIHECLHHWYQNWSETKICAEENRIMNTLSPRQIKNIIKKIGQNV